MDKLLCVRFDENNNDRHRRSFAYKTTDNTLEELESTIKTSVGVTETRYRQRPCAINIIRRGPISVGGNEDLRGQGNLERETDQCRTGQLS